ncbi:MAG: hypothetical protein IKO67_04955 [Bacteroidaceae bacterium]|nr:hypothetical protein [Bacteroidaceae bacterium]MBR4649482.1 hypothetical protein [Bacteroidaceae bacterium]
MKFKPSPGVCRTAKLRGTLTEEKKCHARKPRGIVVNGQWSMINGQ